VSVFGIEAISARRRCVVRSMASSSGRKLKQPYAIFMKDGSPFGIGGLWEN
jgi:putative SOS response-associated peptidase YedK